MNAKIVLSLIGLMGITTVGCSSIDEAPTTSNGVEAEYANSNDTIIIKADSPLVKTVGMGEVPVKTLKLLESAEGSITRSENQPDVFYMYDDMTEKSAFAVQNPHNDQEWIYECQGRDNGESVIIRFEQIGPNEYVTKDENGEILRYFSYDPEKGELWTYNNDTRAMSKRDRILCSTTFTALGWLIGEALAVPTGGASLLMSVGFCVATEYICN